MLRKVFRFLRRLLKTIIVLIVGFTVVPAAMIAIALAIVLFAPVPVTIPARKAQPEIRPTRVFDANGDLLTVFRKVDSNIPVRGEDIPLVLKRAVISAEDRRFYTHNGVDPKGLVRALNRDIKTGEAEQGASTITQQLVNNVYYPEDDPNENIDTKSQSAVRKQGRRVWRKLRVAVIANRLDRKMAKDKILEEYLSNIFLGNGAYGVGAASQVYFRKNVKDLTISEAATIAGIIPAPSKYEPRGNRSNAEFKRKATLLQMRNEKYITADEYNEALAQELWVDPGDGTLPPVGKPVTIVFPTTGTGKSTYFTDYVRRYLIAKYGEDAVYGGGWTVRTTIDQRMQAEAEKAQAAALRGTKKTLEMAIVSVEPQTGFLKAIVGGRSFEIDQVNLALGYCRPLESIKKKIKTSPKIPPTCDNSIDGGGSGRSPGSSIKPIVLAAAFAQNYPPSLVLKGSPYRDPRCKNGADCSTIRNYEGAAYGPVNLRTATIKSVNTSYARLGYEVVGLQNVAKMAQKLGITSAYYDPRMHGPSYSLGGIDVSPLEMASAYAVFAGRGKAAPTTPILTITDPNGNVIEDNLTRKPTQVITQKVADNVTDVLRAVVTEGTGKRAALGDRPVAGKTGTSQNYRDAWFVGYTPSLSTAVWMGYKDRPRQMVLRGVGRVAGGTVPARTWARYMSQALAPIPPTDFDEPAPIVRPKQLSLKEEKQLRERKGIELRGRRSVGGTPESPRYVDANPAPPPVVEPAPIPDSNSPTTSTSTTQPVPVVTEAPTTTVPPPA